MVYTIGEMAKRLNVAPSTLRYYDKEGMLPFIERSSGGIRMFQEKDMSWLQIIECLKKTGMPIKDIKEFVDLCIEGDDTIDRRLEIISKQKKAVEHQIEETQKMLDMLNYKCWYYETAKEAGTCSVHENIPAENIPEKFHKFISCKHRE